MATLRFGNIPHWEDVLELIDDALELVDEVPEAGEEFASSVEEKLRDIAETIRKHKSVTEKQYDAILNMKDGLERWLN